MRVGIAAAGTGGHVYPALAVAEGLRSAGLTHEDIVFFGGDRMEAASVPEAGYPFVGVDIHGIRRSLSVDNVKLPMKVRRARDTIMASIRDNNLEVMVVFGGYISGPAAQAAARTGIPLIVHEANAVPGVANRMVARKADRTYAAFAPAKAKLPNAEVIGSPLRASFASFDRQTLRPTARSRYGLGDDDVVLAVIGGSLGAQFLNSVVDELVGQPDRGFSILHLTGRDHYDDIAKRAETVDRWHPMPFEDEMTEVYASADLVLSRGGALTVSEIQATNTPAVVVPLPAGGGYQAQNASDAVASGGAVVVEQSTASDVAAEVVSLISNRDTISSMASARAATDHRQATQVMVEAILEYRHA